MRAVYEAPSDSSFVVGDVTIDGRPIALGAQIADFVRIKLTVIGTRFGQSAVAPMIDCLRPKALGDPAVLASFAVGNALGLERAATR